MKLTLIYSASRDGQPEPAPQPKNTVSAILLRALSIAPYPGDRPSGKGWLPKSRLRRMSTHEIKAKTPPNQGPNPSDA